MKHVRVVETEPGLYTVQAQGFCGFGWYDMEVTRSLELAEYGMTRLYKALNRKPKNKVIFSTEVSTKEKGVGPMGLTM